MKNRNFAALILSFISLSSCATEPTPSANNPIANVPPIIQTEIDPSIVDKLQVDNIYLAYKNSNIELFAGFKITDDGINHPVIIHKLGDQVNRYDSTEIITDFFVFNNHVVAVLLSGATLSLNDNLWIASDLKLPNNSKVIYSKNQSIITCSPASALKGSNARGSCTSINPNWQIEIPWREITPRICNGALHTITHMYKKQEYWVISIDDGKLISRSDATTEIICPNK